MRLEIIAYGRPAPQGSKRHVGNGIMIESSKAVKPWRDDVKTAAEKAIAKHLGTLYPLDQPIAVRMIFTMPKPTSAPKRRQTWPCRTPDLSKLIRATEDALTNAGVWRDDARVIEYDRTAKVYPGEDPEALNTPGVRIAIRTITTGGEEASAAPAETDLLRTLAEEPQKCIEWINRHDLAVWSTNVKTIAEALLADLSDAPVRPTGRAQPRAHVRAKQGSDDPDLPAGAAITLHITGRVVSSRRGVLVLAVALADGTEEHLTVDLTAPGVSTTTARKEPR